MHLTTNMKLYVCIKHLVHYSHMHIHSCVSLLPAVSSTHVVDCNPAPCTLMQMASPLFDPTHLLLYPALSYTV